MLNFRVWGIQINISIWFVSFFAVVIALAGNTVFWLAMVAMLAHELGHLILMYMAGCPARSLYLLLGRMVIVPCRRPPNRQQELLILSGGILANLIVAGLFLLCGSGVGCLVNLLIAAYNALPAGELDGGSILLALLCHRLLPRRAHRIHLIASVLVSLALLTVGFWMIMQGYRNLTVVFSGIYLMVQNVKNLQYTK